MSNTIFGIRIPFSIHASAKEATFDDEELNNKFLFSIHASAKEATSPIPSLYSAIRVFNPRLREGGDSVKQGGSTLTFFSIHASAKEATIHKTLV